ncbi:MAG: nucleoside monophosphate kinase [Candidatus Aenigmarchaeota archaeon]|nr:nucleoside monophosphate kinase [Candidatus Aenigmarchaeota archaeon]
MNLIIFGPPGSGKGTYASRLESKLGIKRIATGDIFRDEIKKNTELGKKVVKFYNRGELVPDYITIEVLRKALEEIVKKNFILDGFPRTVEQAKALEKIVKIDAIINILAHEEILIEKTQARRICSNTKCDGNYNLADIRKTIDNIEYILPPILPKKPGICDKCGSELYQRADDEDLELIKRRLRVYEEQSKPVIFFYKGKVRFIDIYMNRPPEQIVERILQELKNIGLLP